MMWLATKQESGAQEAQEAQEARTVVIGLQELVIRGVQGARTMVIGSELVIQGKVGAKSTAAQSCVANL